MKQKHNRGKNPLPYLFVIILIAIFLRAWTVHQPFYADESPWPYAAADHSLDGFNFIIDIQGTPFVWTSPPLAPLLYRWFTWPLGVSDITMRLLPFIIGLINILLTYRLARKLYDEKTALVAAGIMAISFWHILASFLVEHDSSILTMFWLLFFNVYVAYEQKKNHGLLYLCGVFLGLALLTKLTGGLMLIALCAYLLYMHRSIKEMIATVLPLFVVGITLFMVFPIVSLLINPSYLHETILHSGVLSFIPSLLNPLRMVVYAMLWATPLLAGLALLSIFSKRNKSLLYAWILTVVVFYLFTKYMAAIDRYMAVMIPALAILAAVTITECASRISWKNIALMTAGALAILIGLNFIPSAWISHDIGDYIARALTLQWDFLFQFHGSGGPGFMTSFIPLGVGIMTCAGLFIAAWATKTQQKHAMALFIAFALAFNLFLVQAFILKTPYPDVGETTPQLASYLASPEYAGKTVYLNDINIAWYVDNPQHPSKQELGQTFVLIGDVYTDSGEELDAIRRQLQDEGGVIVIRDYPKSKPSDAIWTVADGCVLEQKYSSGTFDLGYVYRCDPQ